MSEQALEWGISQQCGWISSPAAGLASYWVMRVGDHWRACTNRNLCGVPSGGVVLEGSITGCLLACQKHADDESLEKKRRESFPKLVEACKSVLRYERSCRAGAHPPAAQFVLDSVAEALRLAGETQP